MPNKFTDDESMKETEYIEDEETVYIEDEETEYIESETDKSILNQRYKIDCVIGKGGMGIVYKAYDTRLNDFAVAIKEISLDGIDSDKVDKVVENFKNEASILITLRHHSIPRILDFFSLDNNKCYIVMDLIEGKNLDEVIKEKGKLDESQVRNYLNQIADVLKYLHSREPKVIFRDLKPSNVMLTKDDEIKLIDFGISRTFKDCKSKDTNYYVSRGFSAPEQYGIGQSDERSDIYSLGALLYTLLIGKDPIIKDFKFDDLRKYIDISDELNNAIMKATDFRPENRPKNIDEFLKLCEIKNHSNLNKNKKLNKKIPAIVCALLILSIGAYAIYNKSDSGNVEKMQNENIKASKDENNEKGKSKEANIDVKNAMRKLYETTGADKNIEIYELNNEQSYIGDKKTKKDFYIFNVCSIGGGTADYNLAVRKKDNKVFYGSTYGIIIPYEDYINENSIISKYLKDYEANASDELMTKNSKSYLKANGAEALYEKVKDILSKADSVTVDFYTGPLSYVEKILSGTTKKELDSYVNKRLYPDQGTSEYTTSENDEDKTPNYVNMYKDKNVSMEELYKEGATYDLDENTVDSLYYEGKTSGYNFALANNNPTDEQINEYIDLNSPENASSIFWINGFFEGYKSVG